MNKIEKTTTIADLINMVAENPGMLSLNLAGLGQIVKSAERSRADGLTEQMTASMFYELWYLPKIGIRKKQSDKTIRERNASFAYWKKYTGDPPLCQIDDNTVERFVDGLYATPKRGGGFLTDQTVKKHCAAISSVLRYAGQKNAKCKKAVQLIAELPEFPEIQKRQDVNGRTPTMREFNRILEACRVATRPILPDITPQEWHECAYLFLYATGIRYEDLVDAQWDRLRKIQDITCLVIPPEREKTHRERIVPLNDLAISTLNRIPRVNDTAKIFRWPCPINQTEKAIECAIQHQRARIAKAAGVEQVLTNYHAIRRLAASMLDPAAAANVLGNNPITCRQHYQTVAVAKRAVDEMPVPDYCKH